VSLVARHLEGAGIATVILGSALDIIEHCGAPRFLFTDFPLGNPCGKPWDRTMQGAIVSEALRLLDEAEEPGVTRRSDFRWSEDERWRQGYMRVDDSNREELRQMGERRRQQQQLARKSGRTRTS